MRAESSPEFKVGDEVEGKNAYGDNELVRGKLREPCAATGQPVIIAQGRAYTVTHASLRAPVEHYTSQPDDAELPSVLPAGTRWHYDGGNFGTFTKAATLEGGFYFGDSDTARGSQRGVQVRPSRVLWETVPRPPEQAEQIPENMRLLLTETRKRFPGAVVSRGRYNRYCKPEESANLIWKPGARGGYSFSGQLPSNWEWVAGGEESWEFLAEHVAAGQAWPIADARKLAQAEAKEGASASAGSVESATREAAAIGARKDAVVFGSAQPVEAWGIPREPEPVAAVRSGPDPYLEHRTRHGEINVGGLTRFGGCCAPCSHCGGPFNVKRQQCATCGVTALAIAAGAQPTELDRLAKSRIAATRESHAEPAGGKSAHPDAWPEGAGETYELFSTHGS